MRYLALACMVILLPLSALADGERARPTTPGSLLALWACNNITSAEGATYDCEISPTGTDTYLDLSSLGPAIRWKFAIVNDTGCSGTLVANLRTSYGTASCASPGDKTLLSQLTAGATISDEDTVGLGSCLWVDLADLTGCTDVDVFLEVSRALTD